GRASAAGCLFLLAASLPGCVSFAPPETNPEVGQSSQSIVNGKDDDQGGDDAVVALMHHDHQFCTGTLVSQRVVVTAAHCVWPNLSIPDDEVEVFFGPRTTGPGTRVAVARSLPHPDWDKSRIPNDIGLIALKRIAPTSPIQLPGFGLERQNVVGDMARM